MAPPSKTAATIEYLRRCQAARAAGHPVQLTTDPAWLVDMAINRRAGWVEDPHSRECVNAKRLPRKATGDAQRHLLQLAYRINTPRLIVRLPELGSWKGYLAGRLPKRFTSGCNR